MSLARFTVYFLALAACAVMLFPRIAPVAPAMSHGHPPVMYAGFQPDFPLAPPPTAPKASAHHKASSAWALVAGRD